MRGLFTNFITMDIRSMDKKILGELSRLVFNYEQDLGMGNLRDSKNRFRPIRFLKKYKLIHL